MRHGRATAPPEVAIPVRSDGRIVKPNVLEGVHVSSGGKANRMHLERKE
ncbi:MAG: hypothetical protein ACREMG_06110 [Gemmatimonadales bacterium]